MKRTKRQEPPPARGSPGAGRELERSSELAEVSLAQQAGAEPGALPAALTELEKQELNQCENILRRGLKTFFEVGNALLTIREGRLYRTTHATFADYCHECWGIGRTYAWRVIGAAERLKLLPSDGSIPAPNSEFQVRPFLRLKPEAFPKAWEQAISRAGEGKITRSLVESLVAEISAGEFQGEISKATRKKTRRAMGQFGEALTWLYEARRSVEKGETERALAAIERVESVLQKYYKFR